MTLQLSFIQLVTICAVVNGFVFSFLILGKKENRFANRFLALTIICMCLTFTPYMLDPSIWHSHRWLAWLPFSLSYWIGPSFYFYVKTLTQPQARFTNKQLWHFSPIVLNYLHSIYHLIYSGNHHPYHWFHYTAELFESMAILSILFYMMLSLTIIKNYQRNLLENVSNLNKIDLAWAKRIIVVIVTSFGIILVFLAIVSGVRGMVFLDRWNEFRNAVLLLYACVLYWLGIHGYLQTQTLQLLPVFNTAQELPTEESTRVIQQLEEVMREEKLFKNPELSLTELSRNVGIPERTISEAINSKPNNNFFQFINGYRVKEVQEKLRDPKNSHLKIMSLAYDSGFNSKASFNRIFKTTTGMTPKEYKMKDSS
ncbi:helix-turn-helix domain-containing protein [Flagellimonas myxillae]|uniref:helix-turn-helix domain-containing protein n=1 Tax=Flagellimonas myxillae TaxID=2942214 RepID=UPI00201F5172|nr:AraC family transcriptional regulator [Muricauda myxillae]MCL6266894.1 AraC family transcriptional regulator [Muricauda myxillae]